MKYNSTQKIKTKFYLRVRDRVAERVRGTEQLRESMREIERKRVVQLVLGLELGFRKITILPLKNVKINQKKKTSFSCFGPVSIYRLVQPDFASTTGIFSGTKQCIGLLASTVQNRLPCLGPVYLMKFLL